MDDDSQYAWGENIGWFNFEHYPEYGACVTTNYLKGYVWAENIGWINLSCLNTGYCDTVPFGVVNDGNGNLSGFAWGENVGWINFSCLTTDYCATVDYGVTIYTNGEFGGWAWGENIGWINFQGISLSGYNVQTCWIYGDDDTDCDGVLNSEDNCSDSPNGSGLGTCSSGALGQLCGSNGECGADGFCSMNQEDTDTDGVGDVCDNCPDDYNPFQFDCDKDGIGDICDPDTIDSYPPQKNGIGDACDCEGDFDCDGDVDGTDAATFKLDFGRNSFLRPCIASETCNGDFSCDGDVDGTDAALFKLDFGRSQFSNPCPACVSGGAWCGYE